MKKLFLVTVFCLIFLINGCGGIPKDALSMNKATLEDRQLQTRIYETDDEEKILVACSALLQDLGFNLDESETELGLLVGSKERSAVDAAQVTFSFICAMMGTYAPYDQKQKIKASIVTSPAGETETRTSVRVTFQRIVWNTDGQISRLERLNDAEMYQGFFDKLSKAIFLEAQGI